MDGTLVDTEMAYDSARREVCIRNLGFETTVEEGLELIGMSEHAAFEKILRTRDVHADVDVLLHKVHEIYNSFLQSNLVINPDTPEFLDELSALGIRRALVTSSTRVQTKIILDQICPPNFFEIIITGDDVSMRKPHPEPYLSAALQLGLIGEKCVSIEDSISGILAAIDAGTYCYGVQREKSPRIERAHSIVNSLSEIPLKQLFE